MTTLSVLPDVDPAQSASPMKVEICGEKVNHLTYVATSQSSNNLVFNIVPSSFTDYMDRAIEVSLPLRATFAGSTTGSAMLDDGYDALRGMADYRLVINDIIILNGVSVPVSFVSDFMPDLLHHFNPQYRMEHPLGAPDITQEYNDSIGGNNNPLANYANSLGEVMKRGSFKYGAITRGATSAVLDFELVSWIHVPELLGMDCGGKLGIPFIRELRIQRNIDLTDKNIWSHASDGATTITSLAVTLNGNAQCHVKWTTPSRHLLPREPLLYDFFRMESFPTSRGSSLAADATTTMVSNNIILTNVPRFCWIFVRENNAQKSITKSDVFCGLTKVSLQFGNDSNLLSSASDYDLWQMSREVGLIDSFVQFQGMAQSSAFAQIGTVGSLFACEFGRHVNLGQYSVGQQGSFNFRVEVSIHNVNQTTAMADPTMYVVFAHDHQMMIEPSGMVSFRNKELIPIEQAMGSGMGGLVRVPYVSGWAQGGSWFSDAFKKVNKFLTDTKILSKLGEAVLPHVGRVPYVGQALAEVAPQALKIVKDYGYGDGGRVIAGKSLKSRIKNL